MALYSSFPLLCHGRCGGGDELVCGGLSVDGVPESVLPMVFSEPMGGGQHASMLRFAITASMMGCPDPHRPRRWSVKDGSWEIISQFTNENFLS